MGAFRKYHFKCSVINRILGNFPDNPEALKYIVLKKAKKDKLTEEEAKRLEEELNEQLQEALEVNGSLTSVKNIFLRDEKGIYMTPRMIKGWLKEIFRTIGSRGYREAINHGVFVEPDRIYFTRNGKPITRPDGEIVNPIQIMTPQGRRSSVKISEYLKAPVEFEFYILAYDRIARGLFENKLDLIAELGGRIGFLGDRSLQEGQCKIEIKEVRNG